MAGEGFIEKKCSVTLTLDRTQLARIVHERYHLEEAQLLVDLRSNEMELDTVTFKFEALA